MPDQPLISTPDYLRNRAAEIHMTVLSLNDDIARQKDRGAITDNAPQLVAWRAWRDRWSKWYGDTDGNTWMWGATGEVLDEFSAGVNKWRDWYLRAFQTPPSMVPGATNPDEGGTRVPTLLWVFGAFGAGVVLVKLLR